MGGGLSQGGGVPVLSAQYAICIVFHLDKMVLSISHTHTHPLTHPTIGTHLSICINFNVHTHTHALTHSPMHVRAATNASTGNPLRGQVEEDGTGEGWEWGRWWSLMATGLNTFCTWQWTTTATTTAYGDAVGNNFWLYFGVHVVGVGMRDVG